MSSKAVEVTPAEQTGFSSTPEMPTKATEAASVQERRTGFLHLPIELRLMIYRLALPTRTMFDITEKPTFFAASPPVWGRHSHRVASERNRTDTSEAQLPKVLQRMEDFPRFDMVWQRTIRSLLLTSRFVREEALDVLYGENIFYLNLGVLSQSFSGYEFTRRRRLRFKGAKLQRIAHLLLVVRHGTSYMDVDKHIMELEDFLIEVLPQLKTLRLLLEEYALPYQHDKGAHHPKCTSGLWRDRWVENVGWLLRLVDSTLPASTVLVTDVGGKQRRKVLEFLGDMSHPQCRLRTTVGDYEFDRHGEDDYAEEDEDDVGCLGCLDATYLEEERESDSENDSEGDGGDDSKDDSEDDGQHE